MAKQIAIEDAGSRHRHLGLKVARIMARFVLALRYEIGCGIHV